MAASKSPPFSGWFPLSSRNARPRARDGDGLPRTNPTQTSRAPIARGQTSEAPGVRDRARTSARGVGHAEQEQAVQPTNHQSGRRPRLAKATARTPPRGSGSGAKGSSRLSATHPCSGWHTTDDTPRSQARDRMTATVTVSASIRGTCCRWRLKSELS
jgi:hypothetical protein